MRINPFQVIRTGGEEYETHLAYDPPIVGTSAIITLLRLLAYPNSTPLSSKVVSPLERFMMLTMGWLVGPGGIRTVPIPAPAADVLAPFMLLYASMVWELYSPSLWVEIPGTKV